MLRPMKSGLCLFAVTLALAGSVLAEPSDYKFYAFQNGLGFGTPEEEAKFLKEIGYDGLSQSKMTGEALAEQIAVFEKHGLSVLSAYLDGSEKPVDPGLFKALAANHGIVELYVRKMTPTTVEAVRETAATAAKMDIKVALYPHHGFAVEKTADAMELIRKVDHPNLGMMFNLCHFLKNEDPETLEKVIKDAGAKLFSVSISGAETGGTDWSKLIMPLGSGDFAVERVLKALEAINYTGPVTLQCYAIKGDKKENLKASFDAWGKLNPAK